MPTAPRSSARGGSPSASGPVDAADPSRRTRPLAAALLGLEALLIAAVATYSFVAVAGGVLDARFGTGLGVFLLLFALAAALAARSILVRGRYGLGYGMTWQFFQALVGASLIRAGMYWQGGLALLLSIVLFVLLARLVTSTPLPSRED